MSYRRPEIEHAGDDDDCQGTGMRGSRLAWRLGVCLVGAAIIVIVLQFGFTRSASSVCTAGSQLRRPVEGVDFVRFSSTELVFQKPPQGASWLVTTIHPDAAIRMWDFFGEGDHCTVDANVDRVLIQAATDEVLSYPLEIPDPIEYVEMLKWDMKREQRAGMW